MHPLDIISSSPNLYLFQKEKIKTNFGGFLFFVYMIVILLILIYYIVDYFQNPKYTLQSFTHFNFKTKEEKEERDNNTLYNPNIKFNITLSSYNEINREETDISTGFLLYNWKTKQTLDLNYEFNHNISNFCFLVVFECNDSNCTNYFEYVKKYPEENISTTYYLNIDYQGFTLNHQDEVKPIKKDINFNAYYRIKWNSTISISNYQRNILYSEKKELFQSNDNDSCGYIENSNSFSNGKLYKYKIKDKLYIVISEIDFYINYTQYIEYLRTRVSELDIIANVLSYMANIFTGVTFIFSFYSGNFNNFKIIETILNKGQPKKCKNKPMEMNNVENNENKQFISIKDDLTENCIQKENNIDNIDTDKENNDKDKFIEEDEDKSTEKTQRIKKLHFFDFFLNNLYICCQKRRQQKIIHMCNKIIYQYASIDILIKNQILLENLIKDYKWNDPSLNNVENNDLFIQLKTYLQY